MHPILIDLGRLKIYSYGFMLALSFLVGILLAAKRAERRGVDPDAIYDLSIILVIAAVIGSRGLYILTHLDNYKSILDIVALWQGGATYYGGLILAVLGAVVYLRRKGVPFLKAADICSPSIAAGIFLTRIGCFLSGCCFGRETHCAVGLVFPPDSPAGHFFPGLAVHPTQLYSSLYGLVIFICLLLVERKQKYDGFLFAIFCLLYGSARFIVDIFRYYESSATVMDLMTYNQLLSLLLIAYGAYLLIKGSRKYGRS
jgi:phosphatidylglycerol:prolipoprotein diacylglycerol transferase